MSEYRENVEELLSGFFDERRAHEAAEDIRLGEELLGRFSGPAPDEAVIEGIKAQIAARLEIQKRRRSVRLTLQRIAVAAVIIAGAMGGLRLFTGVERERIKVSKVGQEFVWEEGQDGDEQLTALAAQIDEIKSEILSVRLDELGDEKGSVVTELETEMADINGDFWKG